jgi:hypothetical protein
MFKKIASIVMVYSIIVGGIGNDQVMASESRNTENAPK